MLETANADVTHAELSLWQQILDLLIDPNVIFVMVSIGLIGIVVELWNPGMIFPGTVGAISLIISLFGRASAARQLGGVPAHAARGGVHRR